MATDARGRCLMATGARVATRLPDRIAGAPLWAEHSHSHFKWKQTSSTAASGESPLCCPGAGCSCSTIRPR
jgi:hypothetical protein